MKIQNENVERIVKLGEMNELETFTYMKEHRDALESVEMIIGGYAVELVRAAEEAGLELDLTYDTLKNLPAAAMLLYNKQHVNDYEDQRNKRVTCRTIAGYFVTLLINNHNPGIEVKSYSNSKDETRPEQWADRYVLKFNHKKNSDLLPYVWEGATDHPIEIDNGFMIDVNPLNEVYARLTGVNLADKGLANMILTSGTEGE